LFGGSKNSDINERGMEIGGNHYVIDVDQASFSNGQFTSDNFADFTLEKFSNSLESE
jgi:hypothetical protein